LVCRDVAEGAISRHGGLFRDFEWTRVFSTIFETLLMESIPVAGTNLLMTCINFREFA
jgi:hypothetical protein